jgi:hypothetical protein
MEELKKLKAKLKKRQAQLEAARMAFDTEMVEWLKEEIYQLQIDIATIEGEQK